MEQEVGRHLLARPISTLHQPGKPRIRRITSAQLFDSSSSNPRLLRVPSSFQKHSNAAFILKLARNVSITGLSMETLSLVPLLFFWISHKSLPYACLPFQRDSAHNIQLSIRSMSAPNHLIETILVFGDDSTMPYIEEQVTHPRNLIPAEAELQLILLEWEAVTQDSKKS